MSKFTSQDNENVVNIETNHGNIILPKKDEPKNEKHAPNHLYGFFGLLAFFGLLTFAIIYAIPKSPEPSNTNTAVNSPVNNPTAETEKQTNANINNSVENGLKPTPTVTIARPTPHRTPVKRSTTNPSPRIVRDKPVISNPTPSPTPPEVTNFHTRPE